jgi:hydroxyethylthiazole kinase-like uncharacterized protein yjeF
LHGRAGSQALEAAALAANAPGELMQRAGLAAARLVLARWPRVRSVLVLAGPGNNGGDGWVLAQRLHEAGHTASVFDATPTGAPRPADAAAAQANALAARVPVHAADALPAALATADLVVDALLGLGASGAPRAAIATVLTALQSARAARSGLALLALDGPSGLDLDRGQAAAACVCPADATLALLTLKPGYLTGQGRDFCGELWWAPLWEGPASEHRTDVSPCAWLAGPPAPVSQPHGLHKGSRGDVWVVGGAADMEGAALLAADAAARGGAGRVLLLPLAADASASLARIARAPHLLALPERSWADDAALAAATVVAGCGGGTEVAATLPRLLEQAPRLVLDADALNAVAHDPSLRAQLALRSARGLGTVLTPHPLEAARLLGHSTAEVQADRRAAAQRLADDCQACVVLKGSGSVVAAPGAIPVVNPSGNAALATAGSGDVLAGWLAALWAQAPRRAPQAVCVEAVWRHGDAADRWRAAGHAGPLPASELAAWMAAAGPPPRSR